MTQINFLDSLIKTTQTNSVTVQKPQEQQVQQDKKNENYNNDLLWAGLGVLAVLGFTAMALISPQKGALNVFEKVKSKLNNFTPHKNMKNPILIELIELKNGHIRAVYQEQNKVRNFKDILFFDKNGDLVKRLIISKMDNKFSYRLFKGKKVFSNDIICNADKMYNPEFFVKEYTTYGKKTILKEANGNYTEKVTSRYRNGDIIDIYKVKYSDMLINKGNKYVFENLSNTAMPPNDKLLEHSHVVYLYNEKNQFIGVCRHLNNDVLGDGKSCSRHFFYAKGKRNVEYTPLQNELPFNAEYLSRYKENIN